MRRTNTQMTVRELIEHLAQIEDDSRIVCTRNFIPGSERVTINLVAPHEVETDLLFIAGEDKEAVIIG